MRNASSWLYRGFQRSVRKKIVWRTLYWNGGETSEMVYAIMRQRPELNIADVSAAVESWFQAGLDDSEGTAGYGKDQRREAKGRP
jgi:hypothetical protein